MDHVEAPYIANLLLPKNPHIVVLGGYKGDTVEFIREHHPTAKISVFEPQNWAFLILFEKFQDDKLIDCYNFGILGNLYSTKECVIYEFGTDAASVLKLKDSRQNGIGLFTPLTRLFDLDSIDFLFINIEGSEYDLLNALYTSIPSLPFKPSLPSKLLVQFHFPELMIQYSTLLQLYQTIYTIIEIGKNWIGFEKREE